MPIMKNWNGYEIYDEVARTKIAEIINQLESASYVPHKHPASDITSETLPVERGGTGATTVAEVRNNLGLGNTSGAVPIANGGTGATTAVDALHNLGIYWGEEEAETYWSKIANGDTLKKNTIYIQIN